MGGRRRLISAALINVIIADGPWDIATRLQVEKTLGRSCDGLVIVSSNREHDSDDDEPLSRAFALSAGSLSPPSCIIPLAAHCQGFTGGGFFVGLAAPDCLCCLSVAQMSWQRAGDTSVPLLPFGPACPTFTCLWDSHGSHLPWQVCGS